MTGRRHLVSPSNSRAKTPVRRGVPMSTVSRDGVLVRRSGNLIELSGGEGGPLPPEAARALEPFLTYDHKKFLFGVERFGHDGRSRKVETTRKQLYRYDEHGRMVLGCGLMAKIKE